MAKLVAPDRLLPTGAFPVVFLAGSIEMGKAIDWQNQISKELESIAPSVWVCNPRRENWDSSWEQSIHNPLFKEQVDWELDHLDQSDLAVFYFQPDTLSPITLMELGHRLGSQSLRQKTLVACPDGFWRKGNIEVICHRYGMKVLSSLEELTQHAQAWLSQLLLTSSEESEIQSR